MLDFYNDNNIKFEYEPINNKFQFDVNVVGASAGESLTEASFSYTDVNSIFVSDTTGNDTTGTGDISTPYKTILKGINECTTTRIYVIVLDSVVYAEDITTYSNAYFTGLYAATGQTPVFSRSVPPTNSDADTIYVSADTGNDSTGDGTYALPYKTIAKGISECDTAHNQVGIIDSATYTESGIEFTGNFDTLFSYKGCNPEIQFTENYDTLLWGAEDISAEEAETDYHYYIPLLNNRSLKIYSSGSEYYFQVFDGNMNIVKDSTLLHSYTHLDHIMTSDNGFAVLYQNSTKFYIKIYDDDYNVSVAQTEVLDDVLDISALESYTDNIVFIYCLNGEVNNGKYKIISNAGSVGSENTVGRVNTTLISRKFSTDSHIGYGFSVFYNDAQSPFYKKIYIYDESSGNTIDTTSVTSAWGGNARGAVLSNGNRVIIGSVGSITAVFAIYDIGSSLVIGETSAVNTDIYQTTSIDIVKIDIGGFAIESSNGYYNLSYGLYSNSGVSLAVEQVVTFTDGISHGNTRKLAKGIMYNGGSSNKKFYSLYKNNSITASIESIISNITLNNYYEPNCYAFVYGDSIVNINNCTLKNNKSYGGTLTQYSIYTDDEVYIDLCDIYDNYGGIFLQNTAVEINDSVIYRINGGYAITITGAGSGIILEHLTIFNSAGGIKLISNDGDETLKNCIFHLLNNYSIDAEASIIYSYSVNTESVNNATAGSLVVMANPLFINEGFLDNDDTNLNIKTTLLGYQSDSPAYNLASDSKDAGAYDVRRVGANTTWTSITIEKPKKINVWHEAAGGVKTIRRDGSIETARQGVTEYLQITWDGLLNADYLKIIGLFNATSNQVRVYPDPITNSAAYNLYKIIYDKLNGSTEHYKLTRTGKQGVSITLGRGYE